MQVFLAVAQLRQSSVAGSMSARLSIVRPLRWTARQLLGAVESGAWFAY